MGRIPCKDSTGVQAWIEKLLHYALPPILAKENKCL
ncbi:MAG TPA: hypothetical protein EYP60_02335 [bacterium (Candidatus Stahlbacteria)]|nr:hypothetical protein [Candidatus Stahlbacteria bacterium]